MAERGICQVSATRRRRQGPPRMENGKFCNFQFVYGDTIIKYHNSIICFIENASRAANYGYKMYREQIR